MSRPRRRPGDSPSYRAAGPRPRIRGGRGLGEPVAEEDGVEGLTGIARQNACDDGGFPESRNRDPRTARAGRRPRLRLRQRRRSFPRNRLGINPRVPCPHRLHMAGLQAQAWGATRRGLRKSGHRRGQGRVRGHSDA